MHRTLQTSVIFGLVAVAVLAGCRPQDPQASAVENFINRNPAAKSFGLADRELALTLDDGPGPGTAKIVAFLKARRIPATFFMVGDQAKQAQYADIIREIADDSLFLIGNHSMTHSVPLTQGLTTAVNEIKRADKILYPKMRPGQVMLMRAPYGALAGSQALINGINAASDNFGGKLSKYIGPVFWDIGGQMTASYGADWACWSSMYALTPKGCGKRYLKEIRDRGKGIILSHDIHLKTAKMLIGDDDNPGILDQLLDDGYTFVSLDKLGNDELHEKFGGKDVPANVP